MEYPKRLSPEELATQNAELQKQHESYQKDYEENVKPKMEALAREKMTRRQALEESGELSAMTDEQIKGLADAYLSNVIDERKIAHTMGLLQGATDFRAPATGERFSRPDDYDRVRDAFKKRVMERLDTLMEKWKEQS